MKKVPAFASEAEEVEFWDTVPCITDYFDGPVHVCGKLATEQLEAIRKAAEDEPDPGPQTRGVVVLHPKLEGLESELRDRNILVVVPPTFDCVDVLVGRILVVPNEEPLVADASSFCYGIVSTRSLTRLDHASVAMMTSSALATRSLWNERHGFLLLLRDDGEHEYRPLVD